MRHQTHPWAWPLLKPKSHTRTRRSTIISEHPKYDDSHGLVSFAPAMADSVNIAPMSPRKAGSCSLLEYHSEMTPRAVIARIMLFSPGCRRCNLLITAHGRPWEIDSDLLSHASSGQEHQRVALERGLSLDTHRPLSMYSTPPLLYQHTALRRSGQTVRL